MKSPSSTPERIKPTPQRIFSRIKITEQGCWEWQGSKTSLGYGQLHVGDRHYKSAHRVTYKMFRGPIPEGLALDHYVCNNKGCANPYHVRPVTDQENILRGPGVAAINARKTHCSKCGGEYTFKSAASRPRPYRICLACTRANGRKHDAKRRPRGTKR